MEYMGKYGIYRKYGIYGKYGTYTLWEITNGKKHMEKNMAYIYIYILYICGICISRSVEHDKNSMLFTDYGRLP